MPADKNSYVCCFNILSEWISADKNSNNICLTYWFLLAKYSATFFLNVDKFCRPFILSGRSFHCLAARVVKKLFANSVRKMEVQNVLPFHLNVQR